VFPPKENVFFVCCQETIRFFALRNFAINRKQKGVKNLVFFAKEFLIQ